MKTLINATRQYNSLTDNGAVTHSTSLNECLDLFFLAGAARHMEEEEVIEIFLKARNANRNLAYQILFWARDCRGGAGEKRFFRIIAKWLNHFHKDEWEAVGFHVPEYGSWKDLFMIEKPNENKLCFFRVQLEESDHANLLAKWFPRKGPWFTAMHKYLKMTPKEFRKILVDKTNVIETQMCNKEFSSIEYSKVPSIAMNKYRNVFMKHDQERFVLHNKLALEGKAKVNASTLHPHELFQAIGRNEDVTAVEAQWQALPNYMEGSTERILPVCDVSASMSMHGNLPMEVSVALGLYISERNEGIFQDAFITFSEEPTMCYVKGENLADRLNHIQGADWGGSTNLQKTFDLVLDAAVREELPESQMPTKLLILSDMEFNQCEYATDWNGKNASNLDAIRHKYKTAGYVMPELIFWNLNGRVGNVPANAEDSKVGLVSGFSPAILTAVLQGEVVTPTQLMITAVDNDRYKTIARSLELFAD